MGTLEILAAVILLCAVLPAAMFLLNLHRYRAPKFGNTTDTRVAVLIPARDAEMNIARCLESVLASREVNLEVLVIDGDSADRTVAVVNEFAACDGRVRLLPQTDLPRGWDGKEFASWKLAQQTDADVLLFLDADVRLRPWAIARTLASLKSRNVSLVSGFPEQLAGNFLERFLLPLVQFILLSFLPMGRMRRTNDPMYAAGCGQFMMVTREAYFASGGHAAIRDSRHAGLRLPKLFRQNGFRTDLVDLSTLATAKMYATPRAAWRGFNRQATEAIDLMESLVVGVFLLLGQVLPLIVTVWSVIALVRMLFAGGSLLAGGSLEDPKGAALVAFCLLAAIVASYTPRLIAAIRFKQSFLSVILHPFAIALLLLVQWYWLVRLTFGHPKGWQPRIYSAETSDEIERYS